MKFFNSLFKFLDKKSKKLQESSHENPTIEQDTVDLLKEYVGTYITIKDFLKSNPDIDISYMRKRPHKIEYISSECIETAATGSESQKGYVIYLSCEVKNQYNTSILFEEYLIHETDLLPLIRNKKIEKLI